MLLAFFLCSQEADKIKPVNSAEVEFTKTKITSESRNGNVIFFSFKNLCIFFTSRAK